MNSDYGLWPLVILNSALILGFAASFVKPKTFRDWRSFGGFSAFIVAPFAEMYGFPLTIYLLSGWLVKRVPGIDLLAHNSGHILEDLFGWGGDPHMGPFHIASYIFIIWGFSLLAGAWKVLYKAQREHALARTGAYVKVRHPQYIGFILIMFGFLLQWPTIPTLIMFPMLIYMYVRLARKEEQDSRREFGEAWDEYAAKTPAFFPHIGKQLDV
jgi:protein-S-isoprenylcysteine O-methyltransferase Ste14